MTTKKNGIGFQKREGGGGKKETTYSKGRTRGRTRGGVGGAASARKGKLETQFPDLAVKKSVTLHQGGGPESIVRRKGWNVVNILRRSR